MSETNKAFSRVRNDQSKAEHAEVVERIRAVQTELKENEERYAAAARDLENANETKLRTRDELSAATAALRDIERNKAHKANQLEGMRGQGDMEVLRYVVKTRMVQHLAG